MDCKEQKYGKFLILFILSLFLLVPEQGFSEEAPEEPQEIQSEGDFQFVEIGKDAAEVTGYTGSETEVRIPDTLGGLSVRSVGKSAFAGTGILSVSVPEGTAYIGERAFASCASLKSVSLPDSIKAMALSAFLGTPLDSQKLFPDDSPKNELELYERWASNLEYEEMRASSPNGESEDMIEKEDIVYGHKTRVQIFPQKEDAFDENAEIDGLIFAYGSNVFQNELKIYSYLNHPCWYWDTQNTDYLISTLPRQNSGTLTSARGTQFFNDLRSIGFFKWDRSYEVPDIACGVYWKVFVKFSNSDKYFASGGANYFPPNFDEFGRILHSYGFEDVLIVGGGNNSSNGNMDTEDDGDSNGWSEPRYMPEIGDRIIEVNGVPVNTEAEYRQAVADSPDTITLTIIEQRKSGRSYLKTELLPADQRTRLGINAVTSDLGGVVVNYVVPDSPGMRCQYKPTRTASEDLAVGTEPGEKKTMTVNGVDYTFCWCPPGEFIMGSPETEVGHESCEKDHIIQLNSGFWMLECEVTQQMWESITNDPDMDQRTSGEEGQGDHYPMYTVNWDECQEFCRQFSEYSGYHAELPTEAQWEYACRAGSENAYAGTGILDDMGWYGENSEKTVHEVKGKKPNAWGLYDMHGNVWEWCSDWFEGDYYKHSPPNDPEGPEYGQHRVIRGGNWKLGSRFCRSAFRFEYDQPWRDPCVGFRFILVPGAAMPEWDDESTETEESIPTENNISVDGEISDDTVLDDEGEVIIEGTVLTGVQGNASRYSIPDSVTEIGEYAFSGCPDLTEVNIPDSVTKIGEYAFQGCSSLTEINIPESVTEIGEHAFSGCSSLTEINIPKSVTKIGHETFGYCSSLTEINIPKSVTEIGENAFGYCSSLTKINIPESVTEIGSGAFSHCSSLTEISVSSDNSLFHCEGGALFEGTVLRTFFAGNDVKTYSIPDFVTKIGDCAFDGCSSLTEINIPDTVTEIGWSAFEYCSSLSKINIPKSVTKIGGWLFLCCSSLTEIKVSAENPVFHDQDGVLFEGTVLRAFPLQKNESTYSIPNTVTKISAGAFFGCSSLTEINIPESVTKIERAAFEDCSSLVKVNIPESVIKIEDSAFRDCPSLTEIHIPESITEIKNWTFGGCSSLTEIQIPESVTEIDGYAFFGCCSLTEINIPDGVTKIGQHAFFDCSSLTEIRIPNSVTKIENWVFEDCSSLEKVYAPKDIDLSKSRIPDKVQIIRE